VLSKPSIRKVNVLRHNQLLTMQENEKKKKRKEKKEEFFIPAFVLNFTGQIGYTLHMK